MVGIAALSRAIYEIMPSIKAWNKEVERSQQLADKLTERTAKQWGATQAAMSEMSPADKRKFLEQQIAMTSKEQSGYENQVKMEQAYLNKLMGTDKGSLPGGKLGMWNTLFPQWKVPTMGQAMGAFRQVTGNKNIAFHEQSMADAQKRLAATTERRVELEKMLADLKEQQAAADKQAEFAGVTKFSEAQEYFKKLKDAADTFSWKMTFAFDKVQSKAGGFFSKVKKEVGKTWEAWKLGDPAFRINMAARGDSLEGLRAKEATATFVAENKEKRKDEEEKKKQTELLKKIADNTKRAVTPYSGIASLFDLFTKK